METNPDAPENGGNNSGGTPAAPDTFNPITSQEALEAVLKDRLSRERNKFSDYGDLKKKASKLDEIEQANKSELEKLTEKLSVLERERDEAAARTKRLEVAAEFGITRDDADLFLTANDEDTLKKQAQRLVDRDTDRKKNGNFVPREGATPTVAGDDGREIVRSLFGGSP